MGFWTFEAPENIFFISTQDILVF